MSPDDGGVRVRRRGRSYRVRVGADGRPRVTRCRRAGEVEVGGREAFAALLALRRRRGEDARRRRPRRGVRRRR